MEKTNALLKSCLGYSNTAVQLTAFASFNMLPVKCETLEHGTTPETCHPRLSTFGNKATASHMFAACASNNYVKGAKLRLGGAAMPYYTFSSPQITSNAR